MIDEADALRIPDRAMHPDPRTLAFVKVHRVTGSIRAISLDDQHAAVARFKLSATAPKDIAIHFETAKNLYLYAWFVYRFYPVAEQHTLITLEFALRMRQPSFVEEYKSRHRLEHEPGLVALLKRAISDGLVTNQAFTTRHAWALRRAQSRFQYEQIEKMHREGLTEMEIDDSDVQPTEEDLDYDWLGTFVDAIPYFRNNYAHGSAMLHNSVLHSFEVVTEIINQLYPEPRTS
jgi:hypothetical protein